MKIDWLKTLIICASIVLAGFFVGNMHKTGKKYDRFVQVKGLSEREVNADLAVWPINITLTANDLNSLKSYTIPIRGTANSDIWQNQSLQSGQMTSASFKWPFLNLLNLCQKGFYSDLKTHGDQLNISLQD